MATPTLVQKAKNHGVYSTSPVTAVFPVGTTAGSAIIAMVAGAKISDPYALSALNANTAAPVLKDNNGLVYNPIESLVNFDGDLGYWRTLYLYYATSATVVTGTKSLTLTDLDSNGRPTFNHGVNLEIFEYSGVLASGGDGHSSGFGTLNPAVAGVGFVTSANGDLIVVAGLMRKSGNFTAPAGFTMVATGRLAGTANDYFGFMTGIQTLGADIIPGFINSMNYEMGVAAVALKHS